jgi:hypothetical protein
MKTTITKKVELTKEELMEILSKHFNAPVTHVEEKMETYGWSGQPWDDGPQCERLCGITITFQK